METRKSYPISILFIVVAVCAILLSAGLGHVKWNYIPVENFMAVVLSGAIVGVIGALIGLHSHQRRRRFTRGAFIGILVGVTIGPLLFVKNQDLPRILNVEIFGSFALIATGIVARIAKSDPLWASTPESNGDSDLKGEKFG